MLLDNTTPEFWYTALSSTNLSSLNCVGNRTPRPLPMSPTRSALVGANTSTNVVSVLLLPVFFLPPKRGIVAVGDDSTLPLLKSTIPFRLKIGLPLFQTRSNGVRLGSLTLSYSYASPASQDGLIPKLRTGKRRTSSPRVLPHQSMR